MFRRDRAITRDDKRRQDGVHIQALTISLANSIPKEVACTSTCTAACREAKSHDVQPEEPDRKLVPVLAAAPSLPDNTTACKSKVYGHTWERQTHAALEHMQKELRRPYDYQSPLPKVQKPPPAAPTPSEQTKTPPAFDIRMLTGNGFLLNLRQPGVEMFSITLDGLDRLIQDKTQEQNPQQDHATEDTESLKQTVPRFLHYCLDFFSKKQSDTLPPHRSIDHKIELTDGNTLGFSHLNKHSLEELTAMRDYLTDNLAKGFVVSSKAPFSSPVLFARKANGGLRFCVDYRKLNALTKKNRYPLPLIDETLARLSKAKIFTKLDIRQAFHRIRMSPESEELTAFRTRYGLFQYKVLPFGLTNGPATFQGYINDVLRDLLDVICTAYLDDILIYSTDELEHEAHVKQVVDRLRATGLQADIQKCEFSVTKTKYLGFIVSTEGIQVDQDKVKVIADWPQPRTVRGV
jgi:hypothetical protein